MTTQPGPKNPNWKGGRSIASNGYVLVKRPDHPGADVRGYVYEHRLVAEAKIGRALRKGEQVHHRNGVKTDNHPDNIDVARSIAEHRVLHRKPGSQQQMPGEANPIVVCACGCGGTMSRFDRYGRPRQYLSGHNLGVRHG